MGVVGYVIAMACLQNMMKPGGPVYDTSFQLAPFPVLLEELKNLEGFTLEDFRKNGFHRVGDLGVYASKALREFMYNGVGNPEDDGAILRLHYNAKSTDEPTKDAEDECLAFFFHKEEVDDHVKSEVNKYIASLSEKGRRQRSVGP